MSRIDDVRLRFHLPVALTLYLGLSIPAAGQPGMPVPVTKEPRHRVVFVNDAVRVIDARLPAGDVTLYHTHDADNVPVVIRGGPLTIQPLGGMIQRSTARAGDVSLAKATYTHQIANVGTGPLHFVDVEIHTASPAAAAGEASVNAGHQMLLEDARVRVLRHRITRADADLHVNPVLTVTVPAGHDDGAHAPAGAPVPGSYWWRDAGTPDRHLPAGTEVVEIEFKSR